jgi:3-oxoacyl-[acyl-carrier-protein] synthase III
MTSGSPSIIILGTGSFAPAKRLTNDDISKIVDTSDEWIVSRTGIRERRIAGPSETPSDMAAAASVAAMQAAGVNPSEIDLVVVGTMTPDMLFPSTACLVQSKLGIGKAACFDLEAACSGFVYALEVGYSLMRSGRYRHALVIGTEKLSTILDWSDRTTCVLFGDGAGAIVLGRSEKPDVGVIDCELGSDGSAADLLNMPGGGTAIPPTPQSLLDGHHFLKMRGKEIFKIAVRVMEQAAISILERHGLTTADVDLVVPHQANLRIIETIAQRLDLPIERFFLNIERYGNTSAASIPLALDEAARSGRLQSGQLVLALAFGAGLTWGAALIRWE